MTRLHGPPDHTGCSLSIWLSTRFCLNLRLADPKPHRPNHGDAQLAIRPRPVELRVEVHRNNVLEVHLVPNRIAPTRKLCLHSAKNNRHLAGARTRSSGMRLRARALRSFLWSKTHFADLLRLTALWLQQIKGLLRDYRVKILGLECE